MTDSPLAPEQPATIANWREPPFNRWSFRNVKDILATMPVRRGEGTWTLAGSPRSVESLSIGEFAGRRRTLGQVLDATYTDAFIVLQSGKILAERYFGEMKPDSPHIVMSVTKSFTGALAGVLVERGVLHPDAPVTAYLPEVGHSAYGDATVRHVLDMTVAVDFTEDYTVDEGLMMRYREASGWNAPAPGSTDPESLLDFLSGLRKAGEHGKAFHYVSPNTDLLGLMLERAAGRSWSELLGEAIWQPMGAEFDAYVTVDRTSAPRAAGGLCLALRDLARFGQLMLDGGAANGVEVVPAWWVDDSRRNGDRAAWANGNYAHYLCLERYRNQWYHVGNGRGAFCALGAHGQYLYVDSMAEAVIAKLSSHPVPVDDALEMDILGAFDTVVRAL